MWKNLNLDGLFAGSNMLLIMLVDEMAKSVELKSDKELKVRRKILVTFSFNSVLTLFRNYSIVRNVKGRDNGSTSPNVWQSCARARSNSLYEMA